MFNKKIIEYLKKISFLIYYFKDKLLFYKNNIYFNLFVFNGRIKN